MTNAKTQAVLDDKHWQNRLPEFAKNCKVPVRVLESCWLPTAEPPKSLHVDRLPFLDASRYVGAHERSWTPTELEHGSGGGWVLSTIDTAQLTRGDLDPLHAGALASVAHSHLALRAPDTDNGDYGSGCLHPGVRTSPEQP